jgi:excisionase family DNA binding protein
VADKEFLSFDESLRELRLKEEELKRLVSEGEIRAFRDGETMKLRKSDVENLRSELSGGDVVDLDAGAEELVFEDDADLDAGMATEEISEVDTILEDDVEDIGEVELDEDEGELVTAAPLGRRTTAVSAGRMETEEENEGLGLRVAMIVTSVVMLLAIPVCLSAASGQVTDLAAGIARIFGQDIQP